MKKIEPGKYVELIYDLFELTPDGQRQLVHRVDADDPERFIYGVTPGMIPTLERQIEGLEQGADFSVKVPAEEGFKYNPDDVVTLEKEIFMVDDKFDTEMIFAGAYVPMMTSDGYRINGKVLEITDKNVVMDFNHPLVGKEILFEGQVKLVRDTTPDDLHPTCGGGCCGGGCDDTQCGQGGCSGCK